MDVQHFEQQILKLAFETNARITAASVAYYLGLPSREANQMLNKLLEDGVLELDSDADGNLFYLVPHQQEISAELRTSREEQERELLEQIDALEPDPQLEEGPVASTEPVDPIEHALEGVELVSADAQEEEEAPAFSPSRNRPPEVEARRATDGQRGELADPPQHEPDGRRDDPARLQGSHGWGRPDDEGSSGRAVAAPEREPGGYADLFEGVERVGQPSRAGGDGRGRDVLMGVTSRSMEPDAWVGNCGVSPVLVNTEARCEPRPLSDAHPTLVSCVDPDEEEQLRRTHLEHTTRAQEHEWWEAEPNEQVTAQSGAMVLSSHRDVPATLDDIEQPEHQPGMALLLSLILCGTGQIYNGEVSKGIMMMVLCFLLWFVLLGWVVHIWSIVDAVVVAERINRRQHA